MFRIGDFSKIAQVSGRLLRYYDQIGLLSPEWTDPQTGYRYYSAQQLPQPGSEAFWQLAQLDRENGTMRSRC